MIEPAIYLSDREIFSISNSFSGSLEHRDRLTFLLAVKCGLSVIEIVNLRFSDFILESDKYSVKIQRRMAGHKTDRLKIDLIEIPSDITDTFKKWRNSIYKSHKLIDEGWFVLLGHKNNPKNNRDKVISRQQIWLRVSKKASDEICKKVTQHTLRFTFGMNLIKSGASIEEVLSGLRVQYGTQHRAYGERQVMKYLIASLNHYRRIVYDTRIDLGVTMKNIERSLGELGDDL